MDESNKTNKEELTEEQILRKIEDSAVPATEDENHFSSNQLPSESEAVTRVRELMQNDQATLSEKSAKKRPHLRTVLICVSVLLIGVGAAYTAFATGLVGSPRAKAPAITTKSGPAKPEKATTPPATTTQTYTSSVDGATFQYPKDWTLLKEKEGAREFVVLTPPETAEVGEGLYNINFQRYPATLDDTLPGTVSETKYSIADIKYEKLPEGATATGLYVQQLIVKVETPTASNPVIYLTYLNLSATNLLQAGQSIVSPNVIISAPFLSSSSQDKLTFGGIFTKNESAGVGGMLKLEASQEIINNNAIFKQAKNILLSYKTAR